jgi:DNA adenine methylase
MKNKEALEISVGNLVPPLRWAGGKRWLVHRYAHALPSNFRTYYEPFLGSGAVFFHLRPQRAVLADVNPELINVYRAIRDKPALLRRYLQRHQRLHSKKHYYRVRQRDAISETSKAARTLYLNRTCWNGLYRVNRQGKFNVPVGTKTVVALPTDDFLTIADALSPKVELAVSDFEPIIARAGKGDFVYVDPPYTVAHNYIGFIKYNEQIFSWADQVRLRETIDRAVARGAKVLVSNANHSSVIELYRDFNRQTLERRGVMAAKNIHRRNFEELLVRCWYLACLSPRYQRGPLLSNAVGFLRRIRGRRHCSRRFSFLFSRTLH